MLPSVAMCMNDGSADGMKDGNAVTNSQEDESVGSAVDSLDSIGACDHLNRLGRPILTNRNYA